jgi:hypothetical protein
MPSVSPRQERRKVRSVLKVIHRHRVAGIVSRRASALVFVKGRPVALLEWINIGGVRTPLYTCDLDPAKLRRLPDSPGTYQYDGLTVDPRFPDTSEADSAGD